ncbi:pleckstrin homology domain-containing family G member 5 isoform X2 [Denticeps clupeoides]|uniref:pleckstrin homology domain-containing family G member 5 isoform X2 n=1 Tax=Denticeps clupeoides TaxID=299321 RepID=UPI0010A3308F|nr:pleckstrin homology domain-containing family G member 5-like isoform X2 [Denticeps clupeoides]
MDLLKPSKASKVPNQITGPDAASAEETDGRDHGSETSKEAERDEGDSVVDGVLPKADLPNGPRMTTEKHRSNTTAGQKRQKLRTVGFATISKGSTNVISRAPMKQMLFTQGSPDKALTTDPPSQDQANLHQVLGSFPVPADLTWRWGDGPHTLEDNWTDLVHTHWMSKTQKYQQEALWELLHTELAYINKLTIITDLVISALTYLQQNGFLQEVPPEKLFSNLPSILSAHQRFWQEVMYPMLQEVRRTGRPFDPLKIEAGCMQFGDRFHPYQQYCLEEEKTMDFTRQQMELNPHFMTYLTWVETHPQCERMRLGDMQAKPHQRITKYPLFLKAILKTTEGDHNQTVLRRMLNSVNNFLESINDYLRLKGEEAALSQCAQKIEGYDLLEGVNEEIDKHVRELCSFDLMSPVKGAGPTVIRKLLLEDTVRIRAKKDSKIDAVLLLFSDVVLVTKAQKKSEKLKVVRPPLALDRIRCFALKDGLTFVLVEVSDLGCSLFVYAVSAVSAENCTNWISAINNAQESLKYLREGGVNERTDDREADTDSLTSPVDIKPEDETELMTTYTALSLGSTNNHPASSQPNKETPSQPQAPDRNQVASRRNSEQHQTESREILIQGIQERRATWNRSGEPSSEPDLPNHFTFAVNHRSHQPLENVAQWSTRPDSTISQGPGEEDCLTQSSNFSRKLNSPRLRRRQPVVPANVSLQASRRASLNSGGSSSLKKVKADDSHMVFTLGSLKQNNHGVNWNTSGERRSIDLGTFSESELEKRDPGQRSNLKNQRISSAPSLVSAKDQNHRGEQSDRFIPSPQPIDSQPPNSPLQGLLDRAKEREGVRRRGRWKEKNIAHSDSQFPLASPVSSTPSPSPSYKEKDAEKMLQVPKPHTGWKEGNVDGSDDERKSSPVRLEGASVDWPGWCFDDGDFLDFDDEWDDLDKTLNHQHQCSEV